MPTTESRVIDIEDLVFNVNNPRYPPLKTQREVLAKIAEHQGMKLVRLAENIVERGLNPTKRILVAPTDEGSFVVLEGNRRIAALKLLIQNDLRTSLNLKSKIDKAFKDLSDQGRETLPTSVECAVTTLEEANYWVQLEHTGENEGVGVVAWDGPAARRFRGGSLALQAIDLIAPYLDKKTQELLPSIYHTNVERLLNTPEAREELGVEFNDGAVTLKAPVGLARARLAAMVTEIAQRQVRVSKLLSRDQRIEYAKEVARRPLTPITDPSDAGDGKAGDAGASAAARPFARRVSVRRTRLIPKHFKVAIKQPRINKIYDELQRLSLKSFLNSGAVLFRVFVELSIDEYAARHSISLRVVPKSRAGKSGSKGSREMTLKEKIKTAADHLENKGTTTKRELHGVRTVLQNKNHPLSVYSLHAFVHNQHYSPSIDELTRTWDNIEAFMRGLWKA